MPLAHAIVPWALSWLAPRYGWTEGYPGIWNWLGLIPIAAGTALLIWNFASGLAHIRELPERIQILPPSFLITYGPYASTNPLYVAELALWLGWATLFGSLVVLLGFVVLTVVIILLVPWEERISRHNSARLIASTRPGSPDGWGGFGIDPTVSEGLKQVVRRDGLRRRSERRARRRAGPFQIVGLADRGRNRCEVLVSRRNRCQCFFPAAGPRNENRHQLFSRHPHFR